MKKPRPDLPAVFRHRWRRYNEPRHASLFALAVVLLVAVTAAAASILKTWAPEPPAPAAGLVSFAPPITHPATAHIGANDLTPLPSSGGFVARHYRVARESARDMVRTAFHEGFSNDCRPLLILAVIAVESRFNPIAESEQGAVGPCRSSRDSAMDKVDAGSRVSAGPSFLPPRTNIAIGTHPEGFHPPRRRGSCRLAALQRLVRRRVAPTQPRPIERRRLEAALPRVAQSRA